MLSVPFARTELDLSSPEREAVEQLIPGYRRSYTTYSTQFTQAPDVHKRPRRAKSEHPRRCSFTGRARGNGDTIAQHESNREAMEELLPGLRRFSVPTDARRRPGRAASELPSRYSFTDRVQVTEDPITQHESGKTLLVIVTCITCHMYSLASSISIEGFTCAKCIEVVRLMEKIAELEARIQTLVDDSNTTITVNVTNANTANATNTVSGAPSVKRNTHSSVPASESRRPTNWVTVRWHSRIPCPPKTPPGNF
ncbi:uncharacterized protein [Misgurnus anguillicaudatus]|uniref:uncharacterized protein n=1 Tax=Misgurnus anguillicaudatus TaxID=75329 RepID=UPI003CCFC33D